jgi:mannose-6-phosphate isomerase-like protein (cupin superfamily)
MAWIPTQSREALLCACKQTRQPPFCDGSHNQISDTYAAASDEDGADAELVDYYRRADGSLKASLDNTCYVIRIDESAMRAVGALRLYPVISPAEGSDRVSQYACRLAAGSAPAMRFGNSDVVLFVGDGHGTVEIGSRTCPVSPETGVCVKPGEAFRVHNDGEVPLDYSICVCPPCEEPEFLDHVPERFDTTFESRAQGVDLAQQEAMGDRFFQVLISDETHATEVTMFIGEIPLSRAAHHRHIYEETITVLSGEGFMWTDHTRTPVRPGDVIYLPFKQAHSLQCTSPEGMRLLGAFYPSMSPAINY